MTGFHGLGSKRIPIMLCIAVIALYRSSALLSHLSSISYSLRDYLELAGDGLFYPLARF